VRTAWRTFGFGVVSVCSSAWKRWTQRSQFAGIRLRDFVRREVVQLHTVVVTQPAQEAARRRREAALVEVDEADDVAERWVGLPVRHRRDDPRRVCPYTFGASWPPFSSSCSANAVTVKRGHGSRSITVMDCGGAMPVDEGTWRRRQKRERRGRWALSVEVNSSPHPPLGFIDPWSDAPRIACSAHINCRRTAPVTDNKGPPRLNRPGTHTRAIITARQPKSRDGPSCPPAHVAHYARGRVAWKGAPAAHNSGRDCGH
jgi:hypothetical protein